MISQILDEKSGKTLCFYIYKLRLVTGGSSGNRIISPENQNFYNISITLHGFLMIFFLVMPGLFGGFGNYFVPIFQGSPEVVYPRVNNFSILILLLSYLFLILSFLFGKSSSSPESGCYIINTHP